MMTFNLILGSADGNWSQQVSQSIVIRWAFGSQKSEMRKAKEWKCKQDVQWEPCLGHEVKIRYLFGNYVQLQDTVPPRLLYLHCLITCKYAKMNKSTTVSICQTRHNIEKLRVRAQTQHPIVIHTSHTAWKPSFSFIVSSLLSHLVLYWMQRV